jgi:hypothetical protein
VYSEAGGLANVSPWVNLKQQPPISIIIRDPSIKKIDSSNSQIKIITKESSSLRLHLEGLSDPGNTYTLKSFDNREEASPLDVEEEDEELM